MSGGDKVGQRRLYRVLAFPIKAGIGAAKGVDQRIRHHQVADALFAALNQSTFRLIALGKW